jgi:hypothetical protein
MQALVYDLDTKLREVAHELERVRADQASAEGRQFWRSLLWIPGDDAPYCDHCFAKQKRLYHVNIVRASKGISNDTVCPECKNRTEQAPGPNGSYWQSKERQAAKEAESEAEGRVELE